MTVKHELIGKQVKVLDKGWIELQDMMGDDLAIVNAARVSFLGESKGAEADKKLLFYLMRHRHTSPFEQVEFKFRVCAPVLVWWQWARHRMWHYNAQCLAGDTQIIFDKPEVRQKDGFCVGSKISIRDLYRRWQTWERERIRAMKLRTVDENSMLLSTARIGDVIYAGVKPGFRVTASNGRQITCSPDHRLLFEDGWKTLAEGTGLELINKRVTWRQLPKIYVNGQSLETSYLYTNPDWLHYQYHTRKLKIAEIAELANIHSHNLELEFAQQLRDGLTFSMTLKEHYHKKAIKPHSHATPRLVEITNIEYVGEIEMYDLVVDGSFPNFIANWFVVHNSGRYTPFKEDDFYVPGAWRKQSKDNKQGSEGVIEPAEAEHLTAELLTHYQKGFALYEQALAAGVAKEQARLFLPGFSVYYTWVAKTDAHNLMHFLSLRMAADAQEEIRVYARAIYEHFFKPALPWTAEAFAKYVLNQA